MAEENKAKYAAEIWESVRLFSRLGKTAYGLLILLVVWVFTMRTGREVLTLKDPVDGFWLPSVVRWWPPKLHWYHPSVSSLTIIGILLLVLGWLLYSRFLSYFWAFVRHFLKPAVFVLGYAVPMLLGLLNLALLPVTIPLSHIVRAVRRRRFRENWLARRSKDVPSETAEQRGKAWEQHLEAIQNAHGKKAIQKVMAEGSWEASYFVVFDTCSAMLGRLLRNILSRCRVGLSPITPQSYVEEFLAAKLPLQVFAQAITRIRGELGELALLDRIRFIELPPSLRLQRTSQAARYSWLFDIDVLLWGTYKASSERVISLNVLSNFSQQSKDAQKDEHGLDYQWHFFPSNIRVDFPTLSFDQEDEEEVYLVLLVAEILALQVANKRWDEGWRRAFSNFQVLDRLSLYGRETVQEILLRVVPPALSRLGNHPLPDRRPMSGRHALVDLAGQWIGSMLHHGIGPNFEELSRRKGKETTLVQLRALAEVCARLEPKNAVAHYRLGALWILTNEKEKALHSFRQAGKLEKESFLVHEIGAQVAAEMPLLGVTKDEEMTLAVWAAHAACAVNTGDKYAIDAVRTMIEKTIPERLPFALLERPEPIAVTIIKEMLPQY